MHQDHYNHVTGVYTEQKHFNKYNFVIRKLIINKTLNNLRSGLSKLNSGNNANFSISDIVLSLDEITLLDMFHDLNGMVNNLWKKATRMKAPSCSSLNPSKK